MKNIQPAGNSGAAANPHPHPANRRDFVKSASLAALGLASTPLLLSSCDTRPDAAASSQLVTGERPGLVFPDGFLWGTATASYQVEGAVNEDGRGPSIWDTFAHTPGKIANNDTGDVACDFYHRYKEDTQHIKALNAKAFRFSIAWSRIFPTGTGTPNQKGVDFYNRMVDELLANGIQPFATLYHWDLPQALQDKYRGWQGRETAQAFGEYAGYMAEKLADRVKHFFTLNELWTFIQLGYGDGVFAPGLKLPPAELNQARHHAVLAHGLAVQAIRAHGRPDTKVGLAENIKVAVPYIETPEHIKAAEIATREFNAGYTTVIMEGKYTDTFLKNAGADAPKFTAEELKIISSPLDFCGINIYNPEAYVRAADNAAGYEKIPFAKSHPTSTSKWELLAPEVLYWGARHMQNIWKAKELYVTENGCSGTDELTPANRVNDTDRVAFLRGYLTQLQRAVAEGAPVKGYFYWSLVDNFEWASGYGIRFGLYYMDYKTLKRYPKVSASYFAAMAKQNAVL